jgi:hypothetical protein
MRTLAALALLLCSCAAEEKSPAPAPAPPPAPAPRPDDLLPGLVGEYFDIGDELTDFPALDPLARPIIRRLDLQVNFEVSADNFAGTELADYFYARWTGLLRVPKDGAYTFYTESDDGSRLWIDGKLVIDNGGPHGMTEKAATATLRGDHEIRIEYYDQGGAGGIRFSWSSASKPKEIVASLFHKPEPPRAADARPAWKLAPDQFARYRVYAIDGDADRHDPHTHVGIFGYEIEDNRYHPRLQDSDEIPLILGFTVHRDLDMILDRGWDYEPLRAKGKVEKTKTGWTFSARLTGLKARVEPRQQRVKDCAVSAEVDFDSGVVTRLRYTYSICFEGGKPVERTREVRLVEVLRKRHSHFEAEVNRAIDRGVEWLWRQFDEKEGHWGAHYDYKEGPTALALLTILKGSVEKKDPRLRRALDWYLMQPLLYTYSVGIGMMAIEAWYSPDAAKSIAPAHKKWMEEAARWLLDGMRDSYWGYPTGTQDYSNTQYAVLGLLAAKNCGVRLEEKPLVDVVQRILQSQERKGPVVKLALLDDSGGTASEIAVPALGWGYRDRPEGDGGPRASMTVGVTGTLTILDSIVGARNRDVRVKAHAAVRSGWAWLASNWALKQNWNHGRNPYYTLYGLERAAMLGGVTSVNAHDWYWEGATWLVTNQSREGWWASGPYVNFHDVCFAILFLKRATARVATK